MLRRLLGQRHRAARACATGLAALTVVPVYAGCGATTVASHVRPAPPAAAQAMGEPAGNQGPCRHAAGEALPLVVDWRSSDRLALEVAMKQGTVVVSYTCDRLEILRACQLTGGYSFTGVSRKEESIQLVDAEEVRANLPLSGVKLGAELERGASLDIALVYVGQKGTARTRAAMGELSGECAGATHFIRAAHVGAFALSRGTAGRVRAAAEIFGAGAGGKSSSEQKSMNKDGDTAACAASKPDAAAPPDECQAAIRLELLPIRRDRLDKGATPEKNGGTADEEGHGHEAGRGAHSGGTASVPKPLEVPCASGLVYRDGKCTKAAEGSATVCGVDDLENCRAQCLKGSGESCYNGGLVLRYGRVGVAARPVEAAALFTSGCEDGNLPACVQLGELLPQVPGRRRDYAGARLHFRKACDAGYGPACTHLASEYELDLSTRRAFALRACRLDADACGQVSSLFERTDPERYRELLRRSCLEGAERQYDCDRWAHVAKAARPPRHDDLFQAQARACALGMGSACLDAGRAALTGEGTAKDEPRARAAFERGCVRWSAESCAELAPMQAAGRGGAAERGAATTSWSRACELGHLKSCLEAARVMRADGEDGDAVLAEKLLVKACEADAWRSDHDPASARAACEQADALSRELCAKRDRGESCARLPEARSAAPNEAAFVTANELACRRFGATGCRRLVTYYEAKKDRTRMVHYAEMGCSHDPSLCLLAYRSSDKPRRDMLSMGCVEDHEGAFEPCMVLGDLLEKERPVNEARIATTYERACRVGKYNEPRSDAACQKAYRALESGDWVPLGKQRALQLYSHRCSAWVLEQSGPRGVECREIGSRLLKADPARARDFFFPMCRPAASRRLGQPVAGGEQLACEYFVRAGGKL